MALKNGKMNMDQSKINLKDNIPRSKRELSEENAWLQHLIYQVRLLSLIVRNCLVLHATRFIPIIQSKHEYKEINQLNLQVNTLKELVGNRLLSDSFVVNQEDKLAKREQLLLVILRRVSWRSMESKFATQNIPKIRQ